MPTNYTDQFFAMDPANPPPVGTLLTVSVPTLTDQNDDGEVTEDERDEAREDCDVEELADHDRRTPRGLGFFIVGSSPILSMFALPLHSFVLFESFEGVAVVELVLPPAIAAA